MVNSVSRKEKFRIEQPAAVLFPLFSAEGEKLWVPGWDYQNISGWEEMREDFIFLTKNHDHALTRDDTIWIVKSYHPESFFVQFYRVEPGQKVGLITVQCIEIDQDVTDVEVTYAYTALGETGREFLKTFTGDYYQEFIASWKTLLLEYFQSQG
jgi:hypothetical protein